MLQWGHVFSDVEITYRPTDAARNAALQWGHVFSDVEIRNNDKILATIIASMGPRLFRRGNTICSDGKGK